ncbi:AMP-binding protein [Bacteroidota bacterium]
MLPNTNVFWVFQNICEEYPEKTAVVAESDSATYSELYNAAIRVADYFTNVLPLQCQPIGIHLQNGIDYIISMLGIIASGNFYLPLDISNPPERIKYFLNLAGCSNIISSSENLGEMDNRLSITSIYDIRSCAKLSQTSKIKETFADDPLVLFYTSGSTSVPKGIQHTNKTLLFDILRQSKDLSITSKDNFDLLFSMSFSASLAPVFSSLLNGATLSIYDIKKNGLKNLNEWQKENQITISTMSVSTLRTFLETLKLTDKKPSDSLRLLSAGGEMLYNYDVENFRHLYHENCILQNTYATTETRTISQFFIKNSSDIKDECVSVGKVVDSKEIFILNENGITLPADEIGEIAVKSNYHPTEYFQNQVETNKFFKHNEPAGSILFLTGDTGKLDKHGFLHITGRKDFQVKIRGHRVNLLEIENAVAMIDGIQKAAVIVNEDEDILTFYESISPLINDRTIAEKLRSIFPDYMLPKYYIKPDKIPVTSTDKIDRQTLLKNYLPKGEFKPDYAEYSDLSIENRLVNIWKKDLTGKTINYDDDYFEDLGGDSLSAITMLINVENEFKIELPMTLISRYRNIRLLAEHIRSGLESQAKAHLMRSGSNDSYPEVFLIPALTGNADTYKPFIPYFDPQYTLYGISFDTIDRKNENFLMWNEIVNNILIEINKVKRSDSQIIIGRCFGGLLAYDVARKINDTKNTKLFLIHTPVIKYKKLSGIGKLVNEMKESVIQARRQGALKWIKNIQLSKILFVIKNIFLPKSNKTIQVAEHKTYSNFRWHLEKRLLTQIDIGKYDGDLVLIKAKIEDHFSSSNYEWKEFANGKVNVHIIDGNYDSFNLPAKLEDIMKIIESYLKQ